MQSITLECPIQPREKFRRKPHRSFTPCRILKNGGQVLYAQVIHGHQVRNCILCGQWRGGSARFIPRRHKGDIFLSNCTRTTTRFRRDPHRNQEENNNKKLAQRLIFTDFPSFWTPMKNATSRSPEQCRSRGGRVGRTASKALARRNRRP